MAATSVVLHDLDPQQAEFLRETMGAGQVVSARDKIAPCRGCFGCWLKTPGTCILQDGAERMGQKLFGCEELLIISEGLYGGFSRPVKNALDRSISYCLPFFTKRGGETHHKMRCKGNLKMHVFFHNAAEMTDEERETAEMIARGSALNFDAKAIIICFVDGIEALRRALRESINR